MCVLAATVAFGPSPTLVEARTSNIYHVYPRRCVIVISVWIAVTIAVDTTSCGDLYMIVYDKRAPYGNCGGNHVSFIAVASSTTAVRLVGESPGSEQK